MSGVEELGDDGLAGFTGAPGHNDAAHSCEGGPEHPMKVSRRD